MSFQFTNDLDMVIGIFDIKHRTPLFLSNKFESVIGSSNEEIIQFVKSKPNNISEHELWNVDKDSPVIFVNEVKIGHARKVYEFKIVIGASGELIIFGRDITDVKKLEYSLQSYSTILEKQDKKLFKMAYTDGLTGVSNRRALFENFNEYVRNEAGTLASVCILDIDHFKQFNDRYGHEFGDHVLQQFSFQVKQVLEDDCLFARIGGEEFCVFSRSKTGEQLNSLVGNILDTLKKSNIITPEEDIAQISFSAGVAEFGIHGESLDDLLNNADKALYLAKTAGRSRVISFSTELFEKRDDTLIPNYRNTER